MKIRVEAHTRGTLLHLKKLSKNLTGAKLRQVEKRSAYMTQKRLVLKTPKGYTGLTRRGWSVVGLPNGFAVVNPTKTMFWLEKGTRAHGPVRAKFLFIPKNSRAAIGGWHPGLKFGKDYVLAKWVKGIKAMKIVERERPIAQANLDLQLRNFVRSVLKQ